MRSLACAGLAVLLFASGCDRQEPEPIPPLAEGGGSANARKLVDAVERICIVSGNDPAAFAEAVSRIGWRLTQVHAADERTTLGEWRSPQVELIYSERPMEFSGGRVWTCSLQPTPRFSPPTEALTAEFTRRLGPARPDIADPKTWVWRPSPLQQVTLTLDSGTADWGPMIFVELAEFQI